MKCLYTVKAQCLREICTPPFTSSVSTNSVSEHPLWVLSLLHTHTLTRAHTLICALTNMCSTLDTLALLMGI